MRMSGVDRAQYRDSPRKAAKARHDYLREDEAVF